jgi:hypothetical protein
MPLIYYPVVNIAELLMILMDKRKSSIDRFLKENPSPTQKTYKGIRKLILNDMSDFNLEHGLKVDKRETNWGWEQQLYQNKKWYRK